MARKAVKTALGNVGETAVSFTRVEVTRMKPQYTLIDDAIAGAVAVKAKNTTYLPDPSGGTDPTRYAAYLRRAVFYGVTGRTLEGMTGEIFNKDPVILVPGALTDLIEDATGEGVGLIQVAKKVTKLVLSLGRSGLFVDFPDTQGAVTRADLENLNVRPVIRHYHPLQIINWRFRKIGAASVLSLVVLEEKTDLEDNNGFSLTPVRRWRILRLDENNRYTVQIVTGGTTITTGDVITPLDAAGNPFDRIPFMFVGSETNDAEIDAPPMFDIADLNIAHYRNSADHEESLFISSQPTLVVTGLTETWVDKYFKNGFPLGSRAALPLPEGASATILEVSERSATAAEMEHKEKQMVALGAKLVEQKSVQRTATEASQDEASEQSILATVADNVSRALEWALYYAALFAGAPGDEIKLQLNKEFAISFGSPEARREAIEAWISGAISFTEMRSALRKGGTATLPDDKAKAEIEADELRLSTTPGATDDDTDTPPTDDPNDEQSVQE